MQTQHQDKNVYARRIFGLRIVNRFRKSEDGVAAIEFGMLVLPFMVLLFAIIETALGFFAAQVFEAGVDTVGRRIRTGQVVSNTTSITEVRDEICSRTLGLFTCADIKVDVQKLDSFPDSPLSAPRDDDGNIDDSGFGFCTGQSGSIIIARVYYEWPIFLDYMWRNSTNLSNGKRVFAATTAFQNEPFSGGDGSC